MLSINNTIIYHDNTKIKKKQIGVSQYLRPLYWTGLSGKIRWSHRCSRSSLCYLSSRNEYLHLRANCSSIVPRILSPHLICTLFCQNPTSSHFCSFPRTVCCFWRCILLLHVSFLEENCLYTFQWVLRQCLRQWKDRFHQIFHNICTNVIILADSTTWVRPSTSAHSNSSLGKYKSIRFPTPYHENYCP